MSNEIQKCPLGERITYGFGDLASCLFWQTTVLYLLFFYTDVFGLTAAAAGTMIFVSRLLDAFFDVVIGMSADRTRSRWGKFRPYILFGAVPLSVAAVLAFTTPAFGDTGKLVYAYVTFIVFMFLYSAVNIPYNALLGVISGDPAERTSASSFKFIGAFLACSIVGATALPLTKYLSPDSATKGWQTTMTLYGVVAVVLFFITFFSTHERIQPIAKEKTSITRDLGDLTRNVPWMLLFAATILFLLFVCIRMSVTTHYFKYYIGEQEVTLFGTTHKYGFEVLASAFNTIGSVFAILGVFLVPWFARLVGGKKALLSLFITAMVCTGAFYFLKPTDLLWIFVLQMIGSLAGGPISTLLWVMYADTADYSEWKTGRRATGLVFSASIMSNKIGWAIGFMIAGLILSTTGFKANIVQNMDVLNGLKAMMSVIPVAIGLVALVLLCFYRLDEPTMKKIKADLDERRKAGEAGAATA
jgi:glycoside/pentoside/hexuronide:cation symporter, GPH family